MRAFESLAAVTAVAVIAVAVVTAAAAAAAAAAEPAGRKSEKKDSEKFDEFWDTSMKEEDFDGMPLPEDTEQPAPVTSTQLTPVVYKVGQRYGVPFVEPSTKEKEQGSGVKDTFMDHLLGASIGSAIAMGSLAMVVMAGKALLLALGAILLTCLSSGWKGGAMLHKSDGPAAGTVYEVVAKPHVSQGHSYSSEVHYEPYAASTPSPFKDFGYGYRHL